MENRTTLYTLDSKDRIRQWQCWAGVDPVTGAFGIFYTDGLEDGKMKEPTFRRAIEKNVGKSNYLSPENQAAEMLQQEVGKKERSNYFKTIELARSNKMWLPMLAHKFHEYQEKIPFPRYSQPKLDGARCNVYWSELEGKVVAKTRTGKDYYVVQHILEELIPFLKTYKNIIIDGELYNHNYKHNFEEIMSLVRQSKPTTTDLENAKNLVEYHVYDLYDTENPDLTFAERFRLLMNIFSNFKFVKVKLVSTTTVRDDNEENFMHEDYLKAGYEGQMIRSLNSIYKVDGRSQDLLKRKIFTDAEFPIVAVEEGEANWTGCAKRIIIRLPDGRTQGCGIDGSYSVNKERFDNRHLLVDKLATVRYFRLTEDGKLYIPVVKDIDRHD